MAGAQADLACAVVSGSFGQGLAVDQQMDVEMARQSLQAGGQVDRVADRRVIETLRADLHYRRWWRSR